MRSKIALLGLNLVALTGATFLGIGLSVHAKLHPVQGWMGISWLETGSRIVNLVLLITTAVLVMRLRSQQLRELQSSLQAIRDLEETSSDLIWSIDREGILTILSDRDHLGDRVSSLKTGSSIRLLREQDTLTSPEQWDRVIKQTTNGLAFRDFQYFAPTSSGEMACLKVSGVPIRNKSGEVIGHRGMTRDKTKEWNASTALSKQAFQDELTGLTNRRGFNEAHQAFLDINEKPTALLTIDLDGFKHVNDVHGHLMGDKLLRIVSNRLQSAVNCSGHSDPTSTDHERRLLARLGGDEFAVLLSGVQVEDVDSIAQSILTIVASPFQLVSNLFVHISASIGISISNVGDGSSSEKMLSEADAALYDVKNSGGNAARFHSDTMSVAVEKSFVHSDNFDGLMVTALSHAIQAGGLHLAYQPIRFCQDGTIASVEVLARWDSTKFGLVPPSIFIPLAEKNGLINGLGEWVLRHALAEAFAIQGNFSLSINLSPIQIETSNIAKVVASALAAASIDPRRLVLEITEGLLLSATPKTLEKLRHIRSLGVRLSLDDFGTGYANIKSLDEIPFDLIKLDRSIIQASPSRREHLLRGFIEVARAFNLPTVIEGIETPDQWCLASSVGATYGQGYLLGRPQRCLSLATGLTIASTAEVSAAGESDINGFEPSAAIF